MPFYLLETRRIHEITCKFRCLYKQLFCVKQRDFWWSWRCRFYKAYWHWYFNRRWLFRSMVFILRFTKAYRKLIKRSNHNSKKSYGSFLWLRLENQQRPIFYLSCSQLNYWRIWLVQVWNHLTFVTWQLYIGC